MITCTFIWASILIYIFSCVMWFLGHTDGMWPLMKYVKSNDGGGLKWVDISTCLTVSRVLYVWIPFHGTWIWPGVCLPWACAWFPVPISITVNKASVSVSVKWRAFLPLDSILLCFVSNLIFNFVLFFLF